MVGPFVAAQVLVPEIKAPNKTEVVVPVVKAEPAVKHVNVSEVRAMHVKRS